MSPSRASAHFAWAEFDIDHRRPIPLARRPSYRRLCVSYLEPVRREFGPVIITSSLRTPSYNRRVGGATRSTHLTTGNVDVAAADFYARDGGPMDWARLLERIGAPGVGVYDDHAHVDTRKGPRAYWSESDR